MPATVKCIPVALLALLGAGALLTPTSADSPPPLPIVEPAKHAGYVESIPGSDAKFEMVAIPGGTYLMGSPAGEAGRGEDEGPQHVVRVRPFWMGKMEVTWDEFDVYRKEKGAENVDANDDILAANPDAITGPTPPYVDETYGHGRDGHPVICLTWHAAAEYCRWLSSKTGKTYRLPTEAEWEWAARAGTTTAYHFGNDAKQVDEYAWYVKNSPLKPGEKATTRKVGTRKANPWGLHDMHGNVAEWCLDRYDKAFYASFEGKSADRPVSLPNDRRFTHVVRGGSWADEPDRLRSAVRRGSDKSWMKHDPQRPQSIWWLTKMDVIGFRVVRAVEEQDNLKGFRSKVTRESKN